MHRTLFASNGTLSTVWKSEGLRDHRWDYGSGCAPPQHCGKAQGQHEWRIALKPCGGDKPKWPPVLSCSGLKPSGDTEFLVAGPHVPCCSAWLRQEGPDEASQRSFHTGLQGIESRGVLSGEFSGSSLGSSFHIISSCNVFPAFQHVPTCSNDGEEVHSAIYCHAYTTPISHHFTPYATQESRQLNEPPFSIVEPPTVFEWFWYVLIASTLVKGSDSPSLSGWDVASQAIGYTLPECTMIREPRPWQLPGWKSPWMLKRDTLTALCCQPDMIWELVGMQHYH